MPSSRSFHLTGALVCVSLCCQQAETFPTKTDRRLAYPTTRRATQRDTYHGVEVLDPYRWLENRDSPEVNEWLDSQNRFRTEFLEALPNRDLIRARLETLASYARYEPPVERSGRYFFTLNSGQEDHARLYTTSFLEAAPRLLRDPNDLSRDGTVSMPEYEPSPDGRYVAFALSVAGSDTETWKVLDVESGRVLEGSFTPAPFSPVHWTEASDGLLYVRNEESPQRLELLYRPIDRPSAETILQAIPAPGESSTHLLWPVTRSPDLFLATLDARTENTSIERIQVDIGRGTALRTPFITGHDAFFRILGELNGRVLALTDLDAPNYRVMAIDKDAPRRSEWLELVPEQDRPIRSLALVGDHLVVCYLKDALPEIRAYDGRGQLTATAKLPSMGTFGAFGGDSEGTGVFFSFQSASTPPGIYRMDPTTGSVDPVWTQARTEAAEAFTTRQVFYKSKDGTRVSMFLCHKTSVRPDRQTPVMLAGYGAFGFFATPSYGALSAAWMELGGIFALPNVRGGGEYGADWHRAGSKLEKQNSIDDFIAAAEWLIEEGYTVPQRIALLGSSAGGLLVGASVIQRPDLFGAALIDSGGLDMLRVKEIDGRSWEAEYGSPTNDAEFRVLHSYSPLHNVREGVEYPAILVSTGTDDDRVGAPHSYKFVAALQAAQIGPSPVLLRAQRGAGHNASPLGALLDLQVDRLTLLIDQFDLLGAPSRAFGD